MSIDAACSSSATAFSAVIALLKLHRYNLAVSSGCSYLGSEKDSAGFTKLGIVFKTGEPRSFDKGANGCV